MITRDLSTFTAYARGVAPDFGPACASAAFVVSPDGFALAAESASDNAYMDLSVAVDPGRALAQHRGLQRALSASLPVVAFPGDPDAPDGLFPNNVFATAPGRLLIGHMRHPVRRREAERPDIRGFFTGVLGRREVDLRPGGGVCELTGSIVIDRARGLGFAGLGERCDAAGARTWWRPTRPRLNHGLPAVPPSKETTCAYCWSRTKPRCARRSRRA